MVMKWSAYFHYDAESGNLIWKERPVHHFKNKSRQTAFNNFMVGNVVNGVERHGYLRAFVAGRFYKAHRIVWEMHYGKIPEGYEIDHIDGNGGNNRLRNLRFATHAQNSKNMRMHKDNSLGFKGVFSYGKNGKFRARIMNDGIAYHLGVFETAEDASIAYQEAAKNLHGEFARLQ